MVERQVLLRIELSRGKKKVRFALILSSRLKRSLSRVSKNEAYSIISDPQKQLK